MVVGGVVGGGLPAVALVEHLNTLTKHSLSQIFCSPPRFQGLF